MADAGRSSQMPDVPLAAGPPETGGPPQAMGPVAAGTPKAARSPPSPGPTPTKKYMRCEPDPDVVLTVMDDKIREKNYDGFIQAVRQAFGEVAAHMKNFSNHILHL